ncbi:AAA family ATPase [Pleomorphovibrio marinus]|uniref:AAA family ATPase n=1 Tax=Pleomorphovibrio marinus TaxID=2164132 RepID=UPI000E09FFC9|nr:SMC family ATPase [Pleomorphovibrio marinus]
MIPIQLEIEGLYSYRKKQTIHFDQLTAAGLFGIFGAVGSGKSSILEGILLALYGSSERLSDRGEKSSLLNLRSSSLSIRLSFKAGKGNVQEYVALYQLSRHSTKEDQIGTASHQFYRKYEEELVPIEEKANEILGMKKEHFKQTVIIPQGKFREFIDLTPGPRAEMMKELFGLERFDLSAKANHLSKNSRDEQLKIKTRIESLGEVDKSLIGEMKGQLEGLEKDRDTLQDAQKLNEEQFKNKESLWGKFVEKEKLGKTLNSLNSAKPEIEKNKENLKLYQKANTLLKPIFDGIEDKEAEREKMSRSVENCTRFKGEYESEVAEFVKEVEKLQAKADQRHLREAKIKDLEKVLDIQELLSQLKTAEEKLQSLTPQLEALDRTKAKLTQEIDREEEGLDSLEEVDPGKLAQWQSAYKERESLEGRITTSKEEIKGLKTKIDQEETALKRLIESLDSTSIEEEIEKAKLLIKQLEQSWEAWMEKKGLHNHAHLLVEGSPCPLCGSEHHPQPLKEGEMEEEQKLKNQLESAKKSLDRLQFMEKEIQGHGHQVKAQEQVLERENAQSAVLEEELEVLKKQLSLENLSDKSALENAIHRCSKVLDQRKKLDLSLKQKRLAVKSAEADLDRKRLEIQGHENRKSTLQSTIAAKQDEIVDMEFCHPYFDKNAEEIKIQIDKVKSDIAETAEMLISKRRVLDDLRRKATANLTQLEGFKLRLEECVEALARLRKELKDKMSQAGFESEEGLTELFSRPMDVEKLENEIREFEDRYLLISSQLEKLESEEGLAGFKEEDYLKAKEKLKDSKNALEAKSKEITLLQQSIQDLGERLLRKKELEKELEKVEKRLLTLGDLQKLFQGNGFVKYVSTIYLRELCATANQRFMRLTKNQLSLDIDDQNTFWIIDYLNGGKKRLLRTLSGGQTFQASLCLALALAEKVKSLNQADQSFFFLDEGFGALDKNALRVVFETLKSLRHENRVVGIISHVEELQQEIGVFAKVDLDPEVGSVVSYSF